MATPESVLQLLNQLVVKSPMVQIVNNIRGRSLIASARISKGTHVFTSSPVVAHPKKQSTPLRLDRVCNHCFVPLKASSSSSSSSSTSASSSSSSSLALNCLPCRMDKIFMNNMKKYHKVVMSSPSSSTSASASPSSSVYEAMVRKLAYRLCKELQDGYENTGYLLNLLAKPEISEEIQNGLQEKYEIVKQQLIEDGLGKELEKFFTLEWYCHALGVLHLNAVGTPVPASGSALYDDISYINHSCSPTVGLMFHGMQATVVALQDLNPSDELFINYAELHADKRKWSHEEVQDHLRYNYGFDCSETCSCGKINNS